MSTKKVTEKTIPKCVIQSLYGGDQYTGDKPWMQFDTWDVELACKLITLNYPVDLEGSGWDSAKKWPLDKWGRGSLTGVMRIFDRALGIAKSSIHAGKIKEHDTPANWIKWAQEKGYDVARLMTANAPAAGEQSAANGEDRPTDNWMLLVQIEAATLWRELKKLDCTSPTRHSIKDDLAKICRKKEIKTDYGIYPAADYIYRHVLRGWTPPTD